METLKINGGKKLCGKTVVQGAKNSVLPCLAATVLGRNCVIHNCPNLKDTHAALKILESLGVWTKFENNTITTKVGNELNYVISERLMKEMRSSVVFLGGILARCKKARISYPGGCSIGARPIDLHLKAFKELGVEIEEMENEIFCTVDKINSARIYLEFPSVGATENIMLLAAVSDAEVEILNCAKEPEILDLQNFINSMGGDIKSSENKIFIKGQKSLYDTEYKIMPDRIAALTYLCAVSGCGGYGRLDEIRPEHIWVPIEILKNAGNDFKIGDNFIEIISPRRLKGLGSIETMPYPGFPTDAQALFMALATKSRGKSCFVERIFENRFRHIKELQRFGAKITEDGNTAYVKGRKKLKGATVKAEDLRGGAALVISALSAKGESVVENIDFIDRGYEKIERSLGDFGAEITRE